MRHTLRITLGLLALGAATSVLVAWGCFARVDVNRPAPTTGYDTLFGNESASWWSCWKWTGCLLAISTDDGFIEHASRRHHAYSGSFPMGLGSVVEKLLHRRAIRAHEHEHAVAVCVWVVGWPTYCLSGTAAFDEYEWGLPNPRVRGAFRRHSPTLPYSPISRGLLLNTLFYAALWAVPLVLIPWFVRRRRARLGLCIACKYELAGLAICPECGLARATPSAGSSPSSGPAQAPR